MRILLIFAAIFCLVSSLSAQQKDSLPVQLVNTKWAGEANVPVSSGVIWYFMKDTVSLLNEEDNGVLEQMTYKLHKDTISLKKFYGNSPCGDEAGVYKITIKDNKLSFTMITDACTARQEAFENPYTLVEPKKDKRL